MSCAERFITAKVDYEFFDACIYKMEYVSSMLNVGTTTFFFIFIYFLFLDLDFGFFI